MHSQQTVRQKYSVMIMKNNDSDVLRILLVNTHGLSASLLDGPWKEIYFDRTTIFIIIKNVYSDVRRYLQRSCLSVWKVCLWMVKSDYIHCLSSWGHFLLTPSYRESNIYNLRTRVCIAVWLTVDAESLPSTNAHITHFSVSICVCPSIYPSICLYVSVHSTINPSYIHICCIRWSGVIGSLSYVTGAHVTVETGNWLGIRYRQITVTYDPISGQMLSWWVSKKMRNTIVTSIHYRV